MLVILEVSFHVCFASGPVKAYIIVGVYDQEGIHLMAARKQRERQKRRVQASAVSFKDSL